MSSQAKKHQLWHLAHERVLKPQGSSGCWVLSFCRHLWPEHLCCCVGIINAEAPRQRRMQQVQPAGVGSPRGDWWEKQKPPRVPRGVSLHLFSRLGVNWCFISTQFPTGRSGPWSRALAPLAAITQAVSDRWQPRLAREREGKKSKAITFPCILCITHA